MKPFYWALGAAFIWGCAPILEKLGLAKAPVFAGLFFRSMGVVIGTGLLLVFKFGVIKESLASPPQGWGLLIAGGFLASILGQICFYHALKYGEASLVVPLAASYPLIAFILGTIFLGEKITLAKLSGMLLVVLGVFFLK